MKSAITVCLVAEAKEGPFVFHDGLEHGFEQAAHHGFDAVEIFPPSAQALSEPVLKTLAAKHGLKVAAIGTGAGWVVHKLHLCSPEPEIRARAREFITGIIRIAGCLHAPAIIGSMQGRVEPGVSREQAMQWLSEALTELSEVSLSFGQPLLYEPLNRYETNLLNRTAETARFLYASGLHNVKILADLFHMNIEESSIPNALIEAGPYIGHVHLADSNRQAIGFGHTEMKPVIEALRKIGYAGYLSAEILPRPDAATAARQTAEAFRSLLCAP